MCCFSPCVLRFAAAASKQIGDFFPKASVGLMAFVKGDGRLSSTFRGRGLVSLPAPGWNRINCTEFLWKPQSRGVGMSGCFPKLTCLGVCSPLWRDCTLPVFRAVFFLPLYRISFLYFPFCQCADHCNKGPFDKAVPFGTGILWLPFLCVRGEKSSVGNGNSTVIWGWTCILEEC